MVGARVCVVGGGAAGFYSAVACAEAAAAALGQRGARPGPGGNVVILEGARDVLRKVKISGGGRCNVTHSATVPASQSYPRGSELIAALEARHGPRDTARWFEARGVALKTERDGRVFPVSDDSASVVQCLRGAAESLGVQLQTGARVVAAARVGDPGDPSAAERFRLTLEHEGGSRSELGCRSLILCCGSAQKRSVKQLLEGLGAALRPTAPSLFSLIMEDAPGAGLDGLQGLSVQDARLTLLGEGREDVAPQRGPLLFTHEGLSGPAVLRLSAWGAYPLRARAYRAGLQVEWLPELAGVDEVAGCIQALAGRPNPKLRKVGEKSPWPGRLPARLWRRLVLRAGRAAEGEGAAAPGPAEPDAVGGRSLADQAWKRFQGHDAALGLARAVWPHLSACVVPVSGRREHKEEFVTAGGVDLGDLDWSRMESRAAPGVHFAGEVLDVDGVTGGFNFQGCWTTGYVAGHAAAEALLEAE